MLAERRPWTDAERALLRKRYPHEPTAKLATALGRRIKTVYAMASMLGLHKTPEYLATPISGRLRPGAKLGGATRFQRGHVTWNKGLRRPGWGPGRMKETQFKKGQYPSARWDPEHYVVGALRWNGQYVDIKFREGPRAWRPFHLWLWEQENGPLPARHAVVFRDGDVLNIELANFELISRADLMLRNSVHNLPKPIAQSIQLLGLTSLALSGAKPSRGAIRENAQACIS